MILLLLIASTAASFSQGKDSSYRFTKEHYLQKSKNQKTVASILTGASIIIALGAMAHDVNNMFTDEPTSKNWYITSELMLATGITLFITSAVNRKKARTVALAMNIQKMPTLKYAIVTNHPLPSLGLSVHFWKWKRTVVSYRLSDLVNLILSKIFQQKLSISSFRDLIKHSLALFFKVPAN